MATLGDYGVSARMREVIRRLSRNTIEEERPAYRYATVQSVNTTARTATVTYSGESTPVTLPYGGLTPVVGATVRIDGVPGDRHIADMMAGHVHDYAATGHSQHSIPDVRNQAFTPQQYTDNGLANAHRVEFISGTALGLSGSFYGVHTYAPWGDDSGGGLTQVAYGSDGVWHRYGTRVGGWGAWGRWGGDTGWIEITDLRNGATAYQTGVNNAWTPRSRRMNGVVYLQGLINTNATTTPLHVATLPVDYRPRSNVMKNIFVSGANYRRMDIGADGAIWLREAPAYSTGWHSIDCSFPQDN